jgi:hypothetical protein
MAACYISTGYTLDCRTSSTGGIKTMWVLGGLNNSITGYTVTNSEVSAIGGQGTWFKFELPKQSGSLSETLGVNTTSQSVTFQPEVVVNLPKLNTQLRAGGEPTSIREVLVTTTIAAVFTAGGFTFQS